MPGSAAPGSSDFAWRRNRERAEGGLYDSRRLWAVLMLHDDGAIVAFELDRGVRDAEIGIETAMNVAQDGGRFAQPPIVEQNVRGKRVRTTGNRPYVQVVHAGDAANALDARDEIRRVDVARNAFEQHVGSVAHQPEHSRDDDRRDEQRERRIDPGRVSEGND